MICLLFLISFSNFDDFADQLTMVFNLVHVLSNYGEFQLSPSLLPLEFAFLNNDSNFNKAIEFKDVHLLGEIIHCLRVFGVDDSTPKMARGLQFLLTTQNLDGSWPTRDDTDADYFRYHAAMCSISALYPRRFRGFGPCEVKLFRILQSMKYSTRDGQKEIKLDESMDNRDLADFMQRRNAKGVGEDTRAIRSLYEMQAQCISHELPATAEHYAFCRLEELREMNQPSKPQKSMRRVAKAIKSSPAGAGSRSRRHQRLKDKEEKAWRPGS